MSGSDQVIEDTIREILIKSRNNAKDSMKVHRILLQLRLGKNDPRFEKIASRILHQLPPLFKKEGIWPLESVEFLLFHCGQKTVRSYLHEHTNGFDFYAIGFNKDQFMIIANMDGFKKLLQTIGKFRKPSPEFWEEVMRIHYNLN